MASDGENGQGLDMDLSICVALSASWRAVFSRNGCRRRLIPSFCDFTSIRFAIAGAPDNIPTRVESSTAVQHLTTALFLSKPARPPLIINRPFAQGELFTKVKGKALPAWAAEFDCDSWAQFFLKYILAQPAVTCVIPATSKARHMADNLKAGTGRLPDARQRKLMVELIQGF